MPVSDQAQQMSMLQQAMQAMQAQQQLGPMIQKLMQAQPIPTQGSPAQTPSPTGQGQGLGALLGGLGAMGGAGGSGGQQQAQQPPTLGIGQPIPMQMPSADPTGQQQQAPLPPNPTEMTG